MLFSILAFNHTLSTDQIILLDLFYIKLCSLFSIDHLSMHHSLYLPVALQHTSMCVRHCPVGTEPVSQIIAVIWLKHAVHVRVLCH